MCLRVYSVPVSLKPCRRNDFAAAAQHADVDIGACDFHGVLVLAVPQFYELFAGRVSADLARLRVRKQRPV